MLPQGLIVEASQPTFGGYQPHHSKHHLLENFTLTFQHDQKYIAKTYNLCHSLTPYKDQAHAFLDGDQNVRESSEYDDCGDSRTGSG